jgi:GTP cyclohydrolase I
MTPDLDAAARALREFLDAVGAPRGEPELRETPERVAQAFVEEFLAGYRVDPAALLSEALPSAESGLVAVRGITFASMCPHHLMPSQGIADIAYLPGGRLVGVGVIARLLDAYARRLVLQETLGQQVADALVRHLGARAAGVVLDAQHACLSSRGERQARARVRTHAFAGEWAHDPASRAEFFAATASMEAR